jgi:hypothetical protein
VDAVGADKIGYRAGFSKCTQRGTVETMYANDSERARNVLIFLNVLVFAVR